MTNRPTRSWRSIVCAAGLTVVAAAGAGGGWQLPLRAEQSQPREPYEAYLDRARALHREVALIDGHNDYPFQIRQRAGRDLTKLELSVPQKGIATDIE